MDPTPITYATTIEVADATLTTPIIPVAATLETMTPKLTTTSSTTATSITVTADTITTETTTTTKTSSGTADTVTCVAVTTTTITQTTTAVRPNPFARFKYVKPAPGAAGADRHRKVTHPKLPKLV